MFKKHIQLTPYNPSDREKWLEVRKHFTGVDRHDHFAVGGSDIATILNMNKYEASIEFYYRAIGLSPQKRVSNLQVLRGIKFEHIIYHEFFRYFNPDEWNVWDDPEHQERFIHNATVNLQVYRTAQRCNAVVYNPKYPHIFINYDFLLHKSKWNANGPLEIKSQQGAAMDHWESGINPAYAIQLQGQMLVGEFNYGELFVLRNAEIPVSFPSEPDANLQERIVTESNNWAKVIIMIKTMIYEGAPQDEIDEAVFEHEPDVEGTEAWINFLKEQHKPENEKEIEATDEFYDNVIEWLEHKEEKKGVEEKIMLPEAKIRKFFLDTEATKVVLPNQIGHVSNKAKLSASPKILKKHREL